jgi:hypothetical protein
MDIPKNQLRKNSYEIFRHIHGKIPTYSRKNSNLFSDKIPRNPSMLTPRIFRFTGDGYSDYSMEKIPSTFRVSS